MDERQQKIDEFLSFFDRDFEQQEIELYKGCKVVDLNKFIKNSVRVIRKNHTKRSCKPMIKDLYLLKLKLENYGII